MPRASVTRKGERRIAIGGKFLDEVRIRLTKTSYLGFPRERHSAVVGEDGNVTIRTMMPTALALFAEGRLRPEVPVDLMVRGQTLPSRVLVEVRCDDNRGYNDVAVLVFGAGESRLADSARPA